MFEFKPLFQSRHRYLVNYTAYAGHKNEIEIQGTRCRVISDRALTGQEIAEEVAYHIREQDSLPVSHIVIHSLAQLGA
ncbi:hypothetical protein [Thermocoleostomius sinensis]|jgi:hypothetical protein|uniref:Uncharacterized protein n=1 Tax=Thermocoleostomius sinensis A174 TaxID=2016057 RepID=A0A9E8ZGZ8_9CYAN|nr:hypothetical protein [Thermocoleostomius sinensis]WAL61133.1 hypothetical protein OXH18_03790 [Thermocoleostomius sinensis A174]